MSEPATPASSASVSTFNPFPGLRAFEPDEDYLYFGREKQIDELLRRLEKARFLAVVGTSGSGKSSLVRAGLVPSLYGGFMTRAGSSWRVAIMRPGGDPVGNLAAALDDPAVLGQGGDLAEAGRMIIDSTLRASSLGLADCVRQGPIPAVDNVLVVVDQFEELFRFKHSTRTSRDEAVAFVKLLLAAAVSEAPLYVVLTMRSDFIGDCMEFPGLPEAINQGLYLVPRMSRDELRLAITGPVGVGGAQISLRLVSRLLNDIEDDRDQLPVLQHALMRMWSYREAMRGDGSVLDLEHYEAVGTMKEALSRHAEETFQELETDGDRKIAELLFKALTDTDRDGRGVRRPVPIKEVCALSGADQAEVVRVIERFRAAARSFLMPPPTVTLDADSVVDMSHESLMRNWAHLKSWAVAEVDSAAMYRRLSEAAALDQTGEGGLWRSPELDIGLRWRETNSPTAAWARRYNPAFEQAMVFLDKSQRARDDHLALREEEERQREEGRRKQLRLAQLLALSMAITIVLAAVLFTYFHVQGRRAEQQARLQAVLSAPDPLVRALLLAELEDTAGLDSGLQVAQQIASAPIPRAVLRGQDEVWIGVAFSADDAQVVTVSAQGALAWWRSDGRGEPRRGAPIRAPSNEEPPPELTAVAFSGDGRSLAAGFKDGTLLVRPIDPAGGADRVLATRDPQHRVAVQSLAFSPDGRRIAAGYDDYNVEIWNADGGGGTVLGTPADRHTGPVSGVGFAADGEKVVSSSWDGTARIWDPRVGGPPVVLRAGGHGSLRSAAFSPDDQWVICASSDSPLIWSSDGRSLPVELPGHGRSVRRASFAPDGLMVVAASEDRTAQVWAVQPNPEDKIVGAAAPTTLGGHSGPVTAAVFSHRGSEIVTISDDGTARIWPSEPGEPRILGRHDKRVESVAFSADGTRVVSASDDRSARIWILEGSADPLVLNGARGHLDWVRKAVFKPAGTQVLTASEDGTYRLWDLARDKMRVFPESAPVLSAAFDAAGSRVVTATKDKIARVWALDGAGGATQVAELAGHTDWVWSAAFNSDGTRVVTASKDRTARIWSLDLPRSNSAATPLAREVKCLAGHNDQVVSAAFSPDGTRVVTASADGTARIWTLNGSVPETVLRHEGAVNDAAFSSNGAWVVTSSRDGTARVWRAEDGVERLVLRHGNPVRSAGFRPGPRGDRDDPTHVATGSDDGKVRVWGVSLSALVDFARNASTACLTADQRVRFLPESVAQARRRFAQCERGYNRKAPAQ